jgi:hypothetical protein
MGVPWSNSYSMVAQKEEKKRAHAPSRPEVQQTPKILLRRVSWWAVLIAGLAVLETMQGQP